MLNLTYNYKLQPTERQIELIEHNLNVCKSVKIKLLQRKLKKKTISSTKWKKLQHRIALLHEGVSNRRKEYHFKLAHQLCEDVGMIFVEDINFVAWSSGLFAKQSLDMGLGQFFNILEYVCSKTDTYLCKS